MAGRRGRMERASAVFPNPDNPAKWKLSKSPAGEVVYNIKDRRNNSHVYDGLTCDLERRLKDPGHPFNPKKHVVDFMRISDHNEACAVEKVHLKKHEPRLNDLTKGGVGRPPAPRIDAPKAEPPVAQHSVGSRLLLVASAIPRLLVASAVPGMLVPRPRL